MTALSARYTGKEHLKNRGQIQYLFSESNEKVGKYPLLLLYTFAPAEGQNCTQVLFSVSKKKFVRAIDRNRLKRLMREAYRNQRFSQLQAPTEGERLLLGLVYTAKGIESQVVVNHALSKIYDELTQRISKTI
jgi:ribonuclease P protein component